MPSTAIILLSGGLDSATAAAIARADGFELRALSFDYGQRHAIEIQAARSVAAALGVAEHVIAQIDLRVFGGSALTDDIAVPKADQSRDREGADSRVQNFSNQGRDHKEAEGTARRAMADQTGPKEPRSEEPGTESAIHNPQSEIANPRSKIANQKSKIPITYVPARNTIFLSYALAFAEARGARDVFIGVSAVDYSGYPDCRPEYIDAFAAMAALATRDGVEGRPMRIHAPLLRLTKQQTLRRGLELGVDYSLTRSCYDPDASGAACGACDSCRLRLAAFEKIGMPDPAPYR